MTFDESGGNEDNRIFTLFLGRHGERGKPAGSRSALAKRYTHYSVLRTIEDNFGLAPLTANDRDAEPDHRHLEVTELGKPNSVVGSVESDGRMTCLVRRWARRAA